MKNQIRKKKTCDGCRALDEVSNCCELRFKMQRRIINISQPNGTLWSMYKYRPLEICTKPLTIKKLMTLKGY